MPDNDSMKQYREKQNRYKRLFESEDGKQVLEDLRRYCFVRNTTYNDHAHRMAFNEGLRAAFLHIDNFINLDLEQIQKLQEGGSNA